MARKSTQELLTEITLNFPDNSSGLITPAVLRAVLNDIVLSYQPAYGLLRQSVPSAQTIDIAPAQMTFNAAQDSIPAQTTSTPGATANIALAARGTTKFEFTADFEAASNRFVTFTLFKNGAATPWQVTGNGGGTGNPVSVAFAGLDYADPAATYSIWCSAEINGVNTTFSNAVFIASISPVNSYV